MDLNFSLPAIMNVLKWSVVAIPLLVALLALTCRLSPLNEMQEIFDKGNLAVAIALIGKALGLALILESGIHFNETIPQLVVSTVLGWLIQVLSYILLELATPKWNLNEKLKEGNVAVGVLVGGMFLVLGRIAAAVIA